MGERMSAARPVRRVALVVSACALVAVTAWNAFVVPSGAPPPEVDAEHYLTAAWNMAADGVFGIHRRDGIPVRNASREPLYPTILTGVMRLDAAVTGDDLVGRVSHECVVQAATAECRAALARWKLLDGFLYVGVVVLTVVAARRWASWPIALAAGGLTATSAGLLGYIDALYTEMLATLLLLAASLALAQAVRGHPGRWGAAAGFALGLLALTKALFLYVIPLLGIVLAWAAWRRLGIDAARRGAAALLVVGLALPGAWVARNATAGFGWSVTTGSNAVVSTRLSYDSMTANEAIGAALWWSTPTNGPLLAQAALADDSRARLDRDNPDGLYERHEVLRDEIEADGLTTAARRRVIPHILLTPLLLFRGTVPWAQLGVPDSAVGLGIIASEAIGRFFLVALVALGWRDFRARRWDRLMFLAPSVIGIGLYAAFSHFIPRYSVPMLPPMAIALAIVTAAIVRRIRRQRA